MHQDAVDLLLTSELLAGVPEDMLRQLDPPPSLYQVSAGDTLIRQGERGEAFYLLVYGRLRVFVEDEPGSNRLVGEVLPGEGVGEMALLTEDLTSATVRAMHDCHLVRFTREAYLQLMASSPEAALQITRTVIKRLREGITNKRRKDEYTSIVLLPIDEGIDTGVFAKTLQQSLQPFLTARKISPESLAPGQAELVGGSSPLTPEQDQAISLQLIEQERQSPAVIYLADFESTEWTRLCLRQADVVLLLSTVSGETGLTEVEDVLIGRIDPELAPRMDLVLLHPQDWQPQPGAHRWLQERKITEHHHVRRDNSLDVDRLARIISGNSINLVLGGGGARGFAQIGVIQALTEAGVPIDRIGGTSMGSIIGAFFAQGLGTEEITRKSREIWIDGKPLSDYTFPALSIVRGRRLHNLVKNALADWRVEDLPVTFFCVSGNLTDVDLMLHDRGPLWEGVRASGSIPGAGPPMFLHGKLLVDGGVLNNLPGDIMLNRHKGYAIIVDVSPQEQVSVPSDIGETISGWEILWSRLNPFRKPVPVPSLFEVLYRTATLSSELMSKSTHRLADLLLVPPLENFGTLSFEDIDDIIEVGYRDTVRALHNVENPFLSKYLDKEKLPPNEGSSTS